MRGCLTWWRENGTTSFWLRYETRPFLSLPPPPPLLAAPPTRPLFSPTSRYVNGSQSGEQSEGEEKFSAPKGVPRTPLFPRPGCAFVAGISIHCKPSFTLFDPTSPWLEISWIEVDTVHGTLPDTVASATTCWRETG